MAQVPSSIPRTLQETLSLMADVSIPLEERKRRVESENPGVVLYTSLAEYAAHRSSLLDKLPAPVNNDKEAEEEENRQFIQAYHPDWLAAPSVDSLEPPDISQAQDWPDRQPAYGGTRG